MVEVIIEDEVEKEDDPALEEDTLEQDPTEEMSDPKSESDDDDPKDSPKDDDSDGDSDSPKSDSGSDASDESKKTIESDDMEFESVIESNDGMDCDVEMCDDDEFSDVSDNADDTSSRMQTKLILKPESSPEKSGRDAYKFGTTDVKEELPQEQDEKESTDEDNDTIDNIEEPAVAAPVPKHHFKVPQTKVFFLEQWPQVAQHVVHAGRNTKVRQEALQNLLNFFDFSPTPHADALPTTSNPEVIQLQNLLNSKMNILSSKMTSCKHSGCILLRNFATNLRSIIDSHAHEKNRLEQKAKQLAQEEDDSFILKIVQEEYMNALKEITQKHEAAVHELQLSYIQQLDSLKVDMNDVQEVDFDIGRHLTTNPMTERDFYSLYANFDNSLNKLQQDHISDLKADCREMWMDVL